MMADSVSYWQQTAPVVPLSSDLPATADVLVVGGGLLGSATTYWLARAGIAVVLLEQEAIGWGATGRNGGFVVAGPEGSYLEAIERLGHETAAAVLAETLLNQQVVRQVLQEEAIACQYREPGQLRLALSAAEEEQLRAEAAALQADGLPASYLEREAVAQRIQTPLAPEIRGGRLKQGQGLVHSARLVRGLAQAALRRGTRACQAQGQRVVPEQGHIQVETSRGSIQAGKVVVAANAWIGRLLPELADFILPAREQMLAYAPLPPIFSLALSAQVTDGEYVQQTPDGTILLGGCSSVAPGADLGIWDMSPSAEVQAALETVLPRLFPALGPLRVVQRWAGLLDYSTDHLPIVDALPSEPRIMFACGFSGHGMPFGLRLGQVLAEAVQSDTLPVALKPYRLTRPTLRPWKQEKNQHQV